MCRRRLPVSEASSSRIWLFTGLYLCLASLILLIHLLPLSTKPSTWAAPDTLLCLTYVLVLRRPNLVPIGLIAIVFLIFDLFLLRPPGLLTAFIVVGAEFLRSRARVNSELPFLIEWALVAGVICGVLLGYRLALFVFGVDLPSLGLSLQHLIGTVLLYPIFVLLTEWLARKKGPRQNESAGSQS